MSSNSPEILVTGATGFVGSNLLNRLLADGCRVRATTHRKTPVITHSNLQYVQSDLTNPEDCREVVKGVSRIFHCAASSSGAGIISSTPMVHVTPNVLINTQLLAAAYEAKVEKFLWLSSTTGYPPTGDRPVKEEAMFDGEPYEAYFFSGWTKRFTELLCQMYGEKLAEKMVTIVLRPTNIYGPHDDFELATSHVTAALVRKAVERWDPLEVWGTGDDLRDVLYVDDMVESMIAAMERVEAHQAFNIGYGQAYTIKEILQAILQADGYADANISFDSSKPSMIPARTVDIGLAQRVLGFQPKTSLNDGLAKTIAWYRQSGTAGRAGGQQA